MQRRWILIALAIILAVLAAGLRPAPATATSVLSVAAGGTHTCAIVSDGGVQCWGFNDSGQLGIERIGSIGDYDLYAVPVDVVGIQDGMVAVTAGIWHSCALSAQGGIKCWGLNGMGQLGDGTFETVRDTPVDVVGLATGVAAIDAGAMYTCALTTAGGVKCWGTNYAGVLGDGSTPIPCCASPQSPVDVVGLDGEAKAITSGRVHSCALTANGGVKCWGSNGAGQLGNGGTVDSNTPVDVLNGNGELLVDLTPCRPARSTPVL